MTYNQNDGVYYGTNAERLANTEIIKKATALWYEYDTGIMYITDGTQWYTYGGAS